MRKLRRYLLASVLLTVLLFSSWAVFANNGGDSYDLSWFTIESGGMASGNAFVLHGNSGQPDAAASDGGSYTVQGGFWHVTGAGGYEIHLPVVIRP